MLNPQDRLTLTEALMPPRGFTLDHAVGTTFTLDLETALTVPLALAAKRIESSDDPLSILDALRRTEEHVDIFAQAGQMSMGRVSSLVTLLEQSVHQVAQRRGLFHPKVWFLRFAAGAETRFRLICASRNLTQDHSWDVIVQLDGEPGDVTEHASLREQNLPMANLLRILPQMTLHAFDKNRRTRIHSLADDWERITWELPDGIRELRFHALGPGGGGMPSTDGIRTLIVSPFLTDDGLRLVRGDSTRETHVLSRPESLERLDPASLDARLQSYVLDDAAELIDASEGASPAEGREPLHGLHAKVIIHDQSDRTARVMLGSANATAAAWRDNTEVMVELVGSSAQFGVRRTLEELGELKEEYAASGGETETEREELEYRLEQMLREIAASPVFMRLDGQGPCDVAVWSEAAADEHPDTRLEWQLLQSTQAVAGGIPVGESEAHVLEELPLEQITPFIVVTAREGGVTRRTVVLASLLGDVEHRRTAVLSAHITDRASFLRLLTMMLDLAGIGQAFNNGDGTLFGAFHSDSADSAGLMEALAKALGYGAEAIADVERLVNYISGNEEQAAQVLPDGFDELWQAVRTAYATTRGASR